MPTEERRVPGKPKTFAQRVWTAAAIVALLGLLFLVLRVAGQIFLVFFAGALGAVFIDGAARYLRRWLPFREAVAHRVAVVTVILLLLGALVGAFALVGPSLVRQFQQLFSEIPSAINSLSERLSQYGWGRSLVEYVSSPQEVMQMASRYSGSMRDLATAILTVVGGAGIIAVLAVFYAFAPEKYLTGGFQLVPGNHRERAREITTVVAHALRRWFVGRLVSMTVVGVMTGVGLWLLGIPAAAVLGLIAGLLSFVPNVGPVLSALPGILLGLVVSPMMAVWAALVYVGVQLVDNYLVTPFVEQQAVSLPAGLLLSAQLLMGSLMGILGLFVATPLLVVVILLVQMLYVEGVLGQSTHLLGTPDEEETSPHPDQSSLAPAE